VQLIIGLDFSRSRSFWQLLKRTIARAIDKKEVCNQNVETFKGMFSRDSILIWHFKSFARKRERMRQWQANQAKFDVILLKRPTSPERWEEDRMIERMMEREAEFMP
jgi:C4-dicarboxylate-specific signal transduction histidine kinase